MITMPPPRYRIEEKGRRLITVDGATGQRVGLAAHLSGDPVFGVRVPSELKGGMPSAKAALETAPPATTKPSALALPRANAPDQKRIVRAPGAGLSQVKSGSSTGRWIIVALLAVPLIFVVFALYLWVPIAVMLWFPATRPLVFAGFRKGWDALQRWVSSEA